MMLKVGETYISSDAIGLVRPGNELGSNLVVIASKEDKEILRARPEDAAEVLRWIKEDRRKAQELCDGVVKG